MSKEYDDYLNEHISAVQKAAAWMLDNLSPALTDLSADETIILLTNLPNHDKSKYGDSEYVAYDRYFYGTKDVDAFNVAWLHHIHHNPHHWQHWVLVNDDGDLGDQGKMMPLEMPTIYAFEMVADWWSFSWRSGNLREVFDWYAGHKDGIMLHENTRGYVERLLGEIREALENV